jgi:hypothetical protein
MSMARSSILWASSAIFGVDFSMFYVLLFSEWIFPCSTYFDFQSEFFHVLGSSVFGVDISMFCRSWSWKQKRKEMFLSNFTRGYCQRTRGHYLWSFNKGLILSIHGKNFI